MAPFRLESSGLRTNTIHFPPGYQCGVSARPVTFLLSLPSAEIVKSASLRTMARRLPPGDQATSAAAALRIRCGRDPSRFITQSADRPATAIRRPSADRSALIAGAGVGTLRLAPVAGEIR
jgi:hypothetical protein